MTKRLILSLLLLLGCSAAALAQHYPFVRTDLNHLQYPAGDSPDYAHFLRKLDTLLLTGRADVRVLHVGGSHVQAGTWSDRLRRRFLSLRYGMDGGRGLVFPYSAAQTNTPTSYNSSWSGNWEGVTCLKPGDVQLGLTGLAVTAQDTSARAIIDLLPRERMQFQQHYAFKQVDVLGDGKLEPILLLGGRDTLRGVQGTRLTHFDLPYYTDWLQLAFTGEGKYTLRGLYLDRPTGGFTLCEAGVNGAYTGAWLRCECWEEDLRRVRPDLVIFSIGINDIQGEDFDVQRFKRHYRELIGRVLAVNPHCAILFSGINDSWRRRHWNSHTPEVEQAFYELAQQYRGVFWDWYGVMGGAQSMERWQEAGLAQADKIHMTAGGYRLVGDLLFDAIMESYRLGR